MKILGIIPARYASSRFPGKPLAKINGKPMIQRVYEQSVRATSLSDLIVATDDKRIEKKVLDFGGKVILTSTTHKSGTERCREVIDELQADGNIFDIIINIQGDEPYISPKQIDQVALCFKSTDVQIATLIKKITTPEDLFNPNVNKVIINKNQQAIYFSRQAIPFIQNSDKQEWVRKHDFYKHIGIYAYRTNILKEITKLNITPLEKVESLEQLRWLENGYKITVSETDMESYAVDTPDDLLKFLNKT